MIAGQLDNIQFECQPLNSTNQKIGVVIPTYKRANELRKCIKSVREGAIKDFDIIVINDSCCKKVSKIITENPTNCVEIKSLNDLWWTKSINLGLKYLIEKSYDVAILLNDDVTVSDQFIDNIVDFYVANQNHIVVSKIVDENGNVWAIGGTTNWPFKGPIHNLNSMHVKKNNKKITWSPGMGTLIPIKALLEIGLFDEEAFPQYLSDADFGLRATRKGWNIIVDETSIIMNDTKSTGGMGQKDKMVLRDIYLIFFSMSSADYLPARLKFTFRHAPFGLRLISAISRMVKIFGFIFKRILR